MPRQAEASAGSYKPKGASAHKNAREQRREGTDVPTDEGSPQDLRVEEEKARDKVRIRPERLIANDGVGAARVLG